MSDGRIVVVGDIHGCRGELDDLLDRVGFGAGDTLCAVGDLVGKGPDSRGVIRRMRELGGRSVRGNHDEKALAFHASLTARTPPPPNLEAEVAAQYLSFDGEDWAYLRSLPYYLELRGLDTIVVHGGLVPGIPLEEQDPACMIAMRSIRPDGTASKRVDEGVPWGKVWPGPSEVVFGHDAVRGLQQHEHATGIDTGCVYGKRLTAYVLPERRLVSVDAHRQWAKLG